MALSEANRHLIAQILRVTVLEVEGQLIWMGSRFTAQTQTDVETQIALWQSGIGTKTVEIYPVLTNKGVKTNPMVARRDIQSNIAVLFERPDWGSGTGESYQRVRG